MSGAEFLVVISAMASIIGVVEATKQVYDAAKDKSGLPAQFRDVASKLPLVHDILKTASDHVRKSDLDIIPDPFASTIKACEIKARQLQAIFNKVVPQADENGLIRYYKAARAIGKGGRVETLMRGVLEDLQLLSINHTMKVVTEDQVKELKEAIEAVSKLEPSIPDEEFEDTGRTFNNYGSGPMNNPIGGKNFFVQGSGNIYQSDRDQYLVLPRPSINNEVYLDAMGPIDPRKRKPELVDDEKGGLLDDCYSWIRQNPIFLNWQGDTSRRVLWIKGEPGKGKTMLMAGISNDLERVMASSTSEPKSKEMYLSYFFCLNTDPELRSPISVLRSLIRMLAEANPRSLQRIMERYDHNTHSITRSTLEWYSLSELFKSILSDLCPAKVYIMIDALDECESELPKLFRLVLNKDPRFNHVKWIISSRDVPTVSKEVRPYERMVTTLELSISLMSSAVDTFIRLKVSKLAKRNDYDSQLREDVRKYLSDHAEATFLWVALACKEINDLLPIDKPLKKLQEIPNGLEPLYDRMIKQIGMYSKDVKENCQKILSTVSLAFRPLNLQELITIAVLPEQYSQTPKSIRYLIDHCGSFLTVRNDLVQFIHLSAKDHILNHPNGRLDVSNAFSIFPSGEMAEHRRIFTTSLQTMSRYLRRDMLNLKDPGIAIDDIPTVKSDALQRAKYACDYWTSHLSKIDNAQQHQLGFYDGGPVLDFLETHFLHWLEVLGITRTIHSAVISISNLISLTSKDEDTTRLRAFLEDAERFLGFSQSTIARAPLQAYYSAILFAPRNSILRQKFENELPRGMTLRSSAISDWPPSHQVLVGHQAGVNLLVLSPDEKTLLSASDDETILVWNTFSWHAEARLCGHFGPVTSLAFSPDGSRLASASSLSGSQDRTILIWDTETWEPIHTLKSDTWVNSICFSPDNCSLKAASGKYIWTWNVLTGKLEDKSKAHATRIYHISFSPNGQRFLSASNDGIAKIWNAANWKVQRTISHGWIWRGQGWHEKRSIGGEKRDRQLASMIHAWDVGEHLENMLRSLHCPVDIAISPDRSKLAWVSPWGNISVVDIKTGNLESELETSRYGFGKVRFSPDGGRLLFSDITFIVIKGFFSLDYQGEYKGHRSGITDMICLYDRHRLVSASKDGTLRVWDTSRGLTDGDEGYDREAISTEWTKVAEDHYTRVTGILISSDGSTVATASLDASVKVWDARTGRSLRLFKTIWGSSSMLLSPDGKLLAVVGGAWQFSPNVVMIWDYGAEEQHILQFQELDQTGKEYVRMAFSSDSSMFAWAIKRQRVMSVSRTHPQILYDYRPDGSEDGRTFSTRVFDIHSRQIIHSRGSDEPFDGMKLSVDKKKLVHRWPDNSKGVLDLRTGKYSGRVPIDGEDGLDDTRKDSKQSCAVEVRHDWIFHNGSPVLLLPWDYVNSVVAIRKNMVVIADVTDRVTFITMPEKMDVARQRQGGRPHRNPVP